MDSDLVFINSSGPDDSKSTERRKAVRSQAARDHSRASSSKAEGKKPRRHRKLLSVQIELDIDRSDSSGSVSSQESLEAPASDQAYSALHQGAEHTIKNESIDQNWDESTVTQFRGMPGAGWAYPFVPYPNKHFVPGVLSHYLEEMAVDIPELDHPGNKGALRSIWFPMVIADQAVLDVVVLTAATHYVMVNRTTCEAKTLYKLKEEAISSINRSLQKPDPVVTDQLIGAVAKMAAYEAGFAGDELQYHVHMRGLMKMVELRGGLESLGLNGLLARMLLWIDLNAAFLLKTKLYFSHVDALPGHTVPPPNPGHFLGSS
ncbi:MAG: hypothetical protein Q9183_003038 [Haloplaca sp. 2 TL-2023]